VSARASGAQQPRAAAREVVMKFGGSSLATPELRALAVKRVRDKLAAGARPVIVVSALGRAPAPYATDTLLDLAPGIKGGPNRDLLLSCGETISASIFAALLESEGIPARALTGAQAGIHTDANHGDARVVAVEPDNLRTLLDAGVTPVVAGFQGIAEDGSVTTIGRGGSDLTAVVLARALGNVQCEILTDVDGVMSADPKRVPAAHTVEELTFEELDELAGLGASVMHDKAAQVARDGRTPYSIRSLRTGVGTGVGAERTLASDHPVTGIATMLGYTFLHVVPEAAAMPGGWETEIFRVMAESGVNLDCINVNAAGVFFIVRDDELELARKLLDALPVAARATRDCAKISIVGSGMRGTPGVMYKVVKALVSNGVPIIHSTDSNITISILVPGAVAAAAEQSLHDYFGLGKDA